MEITTFKWVPLFAQGYVKDLRVRWALEEAGLPYTLRLISFDDAKNESYRLEQPFGQVPVLKDGAVSIFESGSIVLHLGEKSEALLPKDQIARARARTWVLAALNSIEPFAQNFLNAFDCQETWATERRPDLLKILNGRLLSLDKWLHGKIFLEDQFSVGDIMMTTVLRELIDSKVLNEYKNLENYLNRCMSREPFKKALADQLKTFADHAPKK